MTAPSPRGTFRARIDDRSVVRLKTGRIGLMSIDVEAPVTMGHLHVTARSSMLMLELDLASVRVGNPLVQAAARSLVGSGENSRLTFDAKGARDDLLRFDGTARAGDVIVPMEVRADLGTHSDELPVALSGWARFTDVSIPLPGMSRVSTIEVDVSSRLVFVES